MKKIRTAIVILIFTDCGYAALTQPRIQTGAEQTCKYPPLLQNKRIAIVANRTSVIGKTLLVDSLKSLG